MSLTVSCLLKLSLALAVFAVSVDAFPPRLFARAGRREETRVDTAMDCTPGPDGTTPHGCADTVAGNAISYETPGEEGLVRLWQGLEDDVKVVEDERAGTFIIRVPQYQPVHRRGCPYKHIFVAELGICMKERTLREISYRYPSLAARLI
ncbi:uncharacterized protein LOC127002048 [Eriocheir sinensis]|uniref:uncharacterized protein LOC127002048 n=1 Tax=Eriocheir sinensis TaxID=95602 RepID=UPI0021C9DBDB|nr:uncharacterized protein LOC127002048 [Eriocheir sinensis]